MSYKEGDIVLLTSKHIRSLRANKKLIDKFLGPFKVLRRRGKNVYTLNLPKKYGRLHPTFHVSLLEPYKKRMGVAPPEPVNIAGDEE